MLNEAVDIVNIFVDKGELVVSTKGKDIAKKTNLIALTPSPLILKYLL